MHCPACQAENDGKARFCFACGAVLEPALADLRPGALFAGRYEILGSLGRGGMGMVYRALDRDIGEVVAIKVLRPDIARQSGRVERRFRAEIRLARRVRHRNVCSVYGDGLARGLLYICMELVEGENLVGLARKARGLPPEEAWEAVRQVADGLRAIHQAGIVHRDLKTGNLMRDGEGVVRVMDFGIAKHHDGTGAPTITATGTLMGTPEYMSPEHLRGEPVDFRSDVYSFGIVAYELFTGVVPFRGETPVVTILRQLGAEPNLELPRLPPALRPVLRVALSKDRTGRYATAAEMRRALHAARLASDGGGRGGSERWAPARSEAVGETAPVTKALPVRERVPVARIVIGVLGVTALAAHLMSASRRDTAPAPVPPPPLSTTRSDTAATKAVARPVPVMAAAPKPPPSALERPIPAPVPVAPSVPEPLGVVPGELAALVPVVDTSRVYGRDEVDIPPRRVSGQSVPYPDSEPPLSRGERVSVTASFVVTERGDVTDIRFENGDGALRAALVEISLWKYQPGLKDGIPVKVRMHSKHTFVGG